MSVASARHYLLPIPKQLYTHIELRLGDQRISIPTRVVYRVLPGFPETEHEPAEPAGAEIEAIESLIGNVWTRIEQYEDEPWLEDLLEAVHHDAGLEE